MKSCIARSMKKCKSQPPLLPGLRSGSKLLGSPPLPITGRDRPERGTARPEFLSNSQPKSIKENYLPTTNLKSLHTGVIQCTN